MITFEFIHQSTERHSTNRGHSKVAGATFHLVYTESLALCDGVLHGSRSAVYLINSANAGAVPRMMISWW
jgi:hypothetical protein